jgi:hypothetical protein
MSTIEYLENKLGSFAARIEPYIARYEPVFRKIGETVVAVVTFLFGATISLASGGFLIIAGYGMSLSDAVMQAQNGGQPASDTRIGLLILSAFAIAGLIWSLHTLHDLFHPHQKQAGRIAELESELSSLETRLIGAEQFASEADEHADEAEWMRQALDCISDVFRIEGVLDAARKASRRALHPDMHPGASAAEIHELTEKFQMAEAIFDRFSPAS